MVDGFGSEDSPVNDFKGLWDVERDGVRFVSSLMFMGSALSGIPAMNDRM